MSPIKQIHSSQYAKQPLWFKGINSLWGLSYPLGTKSKLEKESLKKAAIKASGLDDFGDFWGLGIRGAAGCRRHNGSEEQTPEPAQQDRFPDDRDSAGVRRRILPGL